MELTYDWKSFQSLFYVKRRLVPTQMQGPAYLVVDRKVIISAFAEGEDLTDWVGATYDEIAAEFANRELVLFDREKVDQWINDASGLAHFYEQIQFLRSDVKSQLMTRSKFNHPDGMVRKHFLLNAIETWWKKVLPSTYGVYIRLDGVNGSSLLLMIQRGKVGSFHVPDLSGMFAERRRSPVDIVKYLSEHYLIPVQGIFVSSAEWSDLSEQVNPWSKIMNIVKSNRTKLIPFNFGLVVLIALRRYFGV